MTWLLPAERGPATLERVYGLCPDASGRSRELFERIWERGGVDPVTLDLCRLRIGAIVGSVTSPRVVDADLAAAVHQWPTSRLFTDAHRGALAFAEQYVVDPHGIDDAHFDALRTHYDEPGIATLTLAVAMFDAEARFAVALEVEPA